MTGVKKSILAFTCFLIAGILGSTRSAARPEAFPTFQSAKESASFPHDGKKHRELDCSNCHSVSRAQPDVRDFPGHKACISCHNFAEMVFVKPIFCVVCHNGRPTSKSQPALFSFPKPRVPTDFGIGFSHVSHRRTLPSDIEIEKVAASSDQSQYTRGQGVKCTDCHKLISPPRQGQEMTIEKGHSTCFVCHGAVPSGGRRKPAREFPYMNDCAQCHRLGGTGSPHLFGIVKGFHHVDHDYDIRPIRKKDYVIAKATDRLCSECHKSVETAESLSAIRLPDSRYCGECHNGRIGLPDPLAQDVLNSLRR